MDTTLSTSTLKDLDKKHIWHPFTQMRDWQNEEIIVIEKGEGCTLIDTEGNRYLDGVSSLWCNVHGHRHPKVDEAVKQQLEKVAHTTFLGLSNVPAIQLSERLIKIAPQGLTRVFYSDSGSEAMEIAVKISYQYWQQKEGADSKKQKFVHLNSAYHGDTLGSVSIGGIDLFHECYKPMLFETFSIHPPYDFQKKENITLDEAAEKSCEELQNLLEQQADEICAFVIEPLMQGAAGMLAQPKGYLKRVREITEQYNVHLICDEVATGFGRTGKMFACDQEGVTPDIMAVAKGITAGYLPLSATLAREKIYEAFLGDYGEYKTFFHGHTYTANPLACAAALANLDIFEEENTIENLQPKIELLTQRLSVISEMEHVGEVRHIGVMVGIELVQDKESKTPYDLTEKRGMKVCEVARKQGAIIRPLGNVVVLMPPLAMSEEELNQLLDIVEKSIRETTET